MPVGLVAIRATRAIGAPAPSLAVGGDGPGSGFDRPPLSLEAWVRLRFQLLSSDPMIAIIGAVGRLTDAGMGDDATETVLRILHETEPDGRP